MHRRHRPWERAICLVDMNAFFASIEQLDFPELRGRPIGVTNGKRGSCVITCSYEARRLGIKTGMRLKEAQRIAPGFVQCPARPERYAAVSSSIMAALGDITPDIEIFSVDEAFLDVTHCQRLWGHPTLIARKVKQSVYESSGLLCSVGMSGDKTTSKYAAKQNKPNGMTIIPPDEAAEALSEAPVTDICGIARGMGDYLAARGVITCGQMGQLPISVLGQRWGNIGRRMWLACQGRDPSTIITHVDPPKSCGRGKVVPPETKDRETLEIYLLHMCEKVAAWMRQYNLQTTVLSVGVRAVGGWVGAKYRLLPSQDGHTFMTYCQRMLDEEWQGEGIWQVQVTAVKLVSKQDQGELFGWQEPPRAKANHVMDDINHRYGEFALCPAKMLNRSTMPNVISPSWKPSGHRENIL